MSPRRSDASLATDGSATIEVVTRKRRLLFGALVVPFTLAASCATTPAGTPAAIFKKEKISSGDEPHLPQSFSAPGCGGSVNGSYKLCISQQGAISSVDVLQGIPDADADIMATLRRWRYKPQVIPVCFVQNLQFQIDCHKSHASDGKTGYGDESQRANVALDTAKSEPISTRYLDAQKVSENDEPPAPDFVRSMRCGSGVSGTYRICVEASGGVSSVEILQAASGNDAPIVDSLKRWRYRPQSTPVCVVKQLDFPAPCK